MLNAGIISDWREEARSKVIAEGLPEEWADGRMETLAEGRAIVVNRAVRAESLVELLNH